MHPEFARGEPDGFERFPFVKDLHPFGAFLDPHHRATGIQRQAFGQTLDQRRGAALEAVELGAVENAVE